MKKPKYILVRFTDEEHNQLKLIAALRAESLTSLIRKAVFADIKNDLKKIIINK